MKWLTTSFFLVALSLCKGATSEAEKVISLDSTFQQPKSNIQWTNFQLEGEEPAEKTADLMGTFMQYGMSLNDETAVQATENVQNWQAYRGGNGGGWFSQDCHGARRGTLRYVEMECGHFAGRVRLHCMAGAFGYSGAGLGHGHGGYKHFHGPITKMLVGAGAYVDRVTFYGNRGRGLGYCGRSGGGGKYWCQAPNSEWSLCAIAGKAGHWLDKWRCGFCHGPGMDMMSMNWWGSFDRKGWSKCPHGKVMHGMWRNHSSCRDLYCIEEVSCGGSGFTHCSKANWWGSFDRKGWSMCQGNTWIAGFWRNGCHNLYCLEEAWCCGHGNYLWGQQGDANWWGTFDNIGYSLVPQGAFMTGLWRNDCQFIYCIELAKYARLRHKPVDCAMGGWSGWSGCSKRCGTGYQERRRGVSRHPAHGGRGCGSTTERKTCNTHHCPIDCNVSNFGNWGACNKKCGSGKCSRSRKITRHPAHGGRGCPALTEYKNCNTHPCPIHCAVSAFGGWETCSEQCGPGMQYRRRKITQSPKYGGNGCPGLVEQRKCQIKPCPVHCKVGAWKPFSKCSKACGNGTQFRTRSVTQENKHGGNACPKLKETRGCLIKHCPVNCVQTPFTAWTKCSKTCGVGIQSRQRTTKTPAAFGGKACGALKETQDCNKHPCPIHCKVGEFGPPTACSKKCGGGTEKSQRQILVHPKHGGNKCPELERSNPCNTQNCPIHGGWSEFGKWSSCTKICQGGIERREKFCTKPKPNYGGKPCDGANFEENACNTMHCSSITNCGDVEKIYVKTAANLDGKISSCNKNLAAFKKQISVADAELAAAKKLLDALNKLQNGSIKTQLVNLVAASIKSGETKLSNLKGKEAAEEKELSLHAGRKNKLSHTKTKCDCDEKRNELTPLVDKAEAQMKINDKDIKDFVKAATVLNAQLAGFKAASAQFGYLSKALQASMKILFDKLTKKVEDELKLIEGKIAGLRSANQRLLKRVQEWKKELGDCDKAVAVAASKLKQLLEEFGMEYIWEQSAFGEFYFNYREFTETDMQEFHEEVLGSSNFVVGEEDAEIQSADTTVSTSAIAEYGLSGLMVFGGIFAFIAGTRQRKKIDEYTPLFE